MKLITLLSFIAPFGLLAASSSHQTTDDPNLLKAALTGYFTAIENKDFAKLTALTTNDFVLYEDGSVWNNDSAFMNIKRHMPFTVKYKIDNVKIFVDNMSGDMTYTNHADFVFKDNKQLSIDWIESATFRKIDGVWKMNFLQLTRKR